MSSLMEWATENNTAVVRPYLSEDLEGGGILYGDAYVIECSWAAQAEQRRDANGAEFVTRNIIWTVDKRPKHRDLITLNDGSELEQEIRSVKNWDMSAFDEPNDPDFELGT